MKDRKTERQEDRKTNNRKTHRHKERMPRRQKDRHEQKYIKKINCQHFIKIKKTKYFW